MQILEPGRPWMDIDGQSDAVGADVTESSRRDFLKLFGLGAAASLAACGRLPVREAIPLLVPAEDATPGVSTHYASTCLACPSSCGLLTTVRDGRPVKLEGDPRHPYSLGGLCAIGQGELRGLYEPTRLRGTSIDGRAATWAALDQRVSEQLRRLSAVATKDRAIIVFTPTIVSPTTRAVVAGFVDYFGAELVEHDPGLSASPTIGEAYKLLDGTARYPVLDLTSTDVWISLASDPLGAGPDVVANTAGWASRRRAASERGLLRHVQIESSMSLTGANADERWLQTAHERRDVALLLLKGVCERVGGTLAQDTLVKLGGLEPATADGGRLNGIIAELTGAGRHSLVTSGADDLVEQLAVAMLNRVLGGEGTTLVCEQRATTSRRDALSYLESAVVDGRVAALIVIDSDPVAEIADSARFAAALGRLELGVAIATQPNMTTRSANIVVGAHHTLERWSDAAPRPGLHTLAQPSVRPLFDTREPFLNLARWTGVDGEWRELLEANWRARVSTPATVAIPGGWSELWARTIRSAGLGESLAWYSWPSLARAEPVNSVVDAAVTLQDHDARLKDPQPFAADGDLVELIEEVAMRDGSRAHVPWLRELPDPVTRVSWSACVRLAPQRAHTLGVRDGDVISITTAAGAVRMPVRIQPGQHPRVVAVPIGYGRAAGDPEDWNGFRLRSPDVSNLAIAATLARTGERALMPIVQTEADTHGRPIVHQLTRLGERVHAPHVPDADLWPKRDVTSPHWEMVIDLDTCTGCSACVVACQAENNIPVVGPEEMARHRDMHWLRLDRYYLGDAESPDVLFEPMLCAQCGDAPCETVCPVVATVHSTDGLNQQIYNRCVGTRYCANNCPYKVRRFNWFDNQPTEPIERMVLNPDVVVRSRGVMEKCTFCVQRIQAKRIAARRDGEAVFGVQTACQQSCPAQAIQFGDATIADGPLATLKRRANAFQVLAELGIAPSITYLARHRNRTDGDHAGENKHGEGA